MKSAKLLQFLVVITAISAVSGLSKKATMLLKDNTPLYTIYQAEGFIAQTSAGLGLNGTDVGVCKPLITGDINLGWGMPSTARVEIAYLLWQAASDADTPNFVLSLDDVVVTSSTNVSAGAACNKITGTQTYIKNAWGFVSDVTDQVAAKLEATTSVTVSFGIKFEVDCSKALAAANGVSLVVVAFDKSLPYTYIELRAGAFAYDKKFNQGSGVFGVFTNVFEIPPVGIFDGDRVAEKVLLLTSIIGEGEDFGSRELSEGFYLNGQYVTYPIDGTDVGGRWDTLHIPLDSYVSDTDTNVNFTVVSPLDCLLFVGQAIQFEKQPGNSSIITDIVEDPHIRTWDGVGVTVYVEGDYILAESKSLGLAVHARFCKNTRGPWAPWTCALAVKCDHASPLVEVLADAFVGATTSAGRNAPEVAQLSGHVKDISCANGLRALVTRHRFHRMNYLNVRLALTAGVIAEDLRGLSGTPNGNPADDLQSRDGRLFKLEAARGHYVAHTSAELDEIHSSWMVTESDRMFSSPFPLAVSMNTQSALRGLLVSRAAVAAMARSPSARSIRRLAESQCRAAGLRGVVETAMCVHDAIALGSANATPNLAAFLSAVRDL